MKAHFSRGDRFFSFLAAVVRRVPVALRGKATILYTLLWRMSSAKKATCSIGEIELEFDLDEEFQRWMLVRLYEPKTEMLLRRALREGDTYIDVGAQIGYLAAIAAQEVGPSGNLILFEPDPRARARLAASFDAAPKELIPRTRIFECGLAARDEQRRFRLHRELGHSRVVTETDPSGEMIQLRSGDALLHEQGIAAADVLKIDVEGFEIQVLAGLQGLMSRKSLRLIIIERNVDYMRDAGLESFMLHSLIARHGYRGFRESNAEPVTKATLSEVSEAVENLFYLREDSVGLLAAKAHAEPDGFAAEELEYYAAAASDESHPLQGALNAIALVRGGDLSRGIEEGERLIQADSSIGWFRGHLARWHRHAGNDSRARQLLEELVALTPDDPGARQALDELLPERE